MRSEDLLEVVMMRGLTATFLLQFIRRGGGRLLVRLRQG